MTDDGRRHPMSRSGLYTWVSNVYTFIICAHHTNTHTHTPNKIKKKIPTSFFFPTASGHFLCDLLSLMKRASLENWQMLPLSLFAQSVFLPLFNDILLTVFLFSIQIEFSLYIASKVSNNFLSILLHIFPSFLWLFCIPLALYLGFQSVENSGYFSFLLVPIIWYTLSYGIIICTLTSGD